MGTNQDLLSYNLFTYCSNNPINRSDPSGLAWWDNVGNWIHSAVNAVVSTVRSVVSAVSSWAGSAWNSASHWANNTFVSAGISSASYSEIPKYRKTEHRMVKSHEANPRNEFSSRAVKVLDSKPLKAIKNVSKVCKAVSIVLTCKSFIDDTKLKNPGVAIAIDAASIVASVAVGAAIGALGCATLPAVAMGVLLTGASAVIIGSVTDYAKEKYCD